MNVAPSEPGSRAEAADSQSPRRPLLPARAAAIGTLSVALAGFVVMAVWLHDRSSETGVDHAIRVWLFAHFGSAVQRALLDLSEPVLTIGVIVLVGAIALVRRHWDVAALCAIGPLLGLVLESAVLKPLIGRQYILYSGSLRFPPVGVQPGLAFPSGHETGLVSATALLALLMLRAPLARGYKIAGAVALVAWSGLGALGLVRSLYHYATDTVGGMLLGVMVIGGTALVIDLLVERVGSGLSSPGGRGRTRTARAA